MDAQTQEQQAFAQELIKIAALEFPGALLAALGAFALLDAQPHTLHPLLGNQALVWAILLSGIAIMCWATWRILALIQRRQAAARINESGGAGAR